MSKSSSYARGHKETSTTGKWDPGNVSVDTMRGDLAAKLGISPSSGDDDVQPTDVVGTDTDGTPMTMGELAARMNWIYQALLEKGWLNEQLDRIEENTR